MFNQSVILPPELLNEVESFSSRNRHLGYITKEEFIRDTTRWRLKTLSEEYETIEIPRDEYKELRRL